MRDPTTPTRPDCPHSERVLLLVDFINPLDFPGAERLAEPALQAAQAVETVLMCDVRPAAMVEVRS